MTSRACGWLAACVLAGAASGCAPSDGELVTIVARTGTPTVEANGVLVDIQVHATDDRQLQLAVVGGTVTVIGTAAPTSTVCVEAVAAGGHVYTVQLGFAGDEVLLAARLLATAAPPCSGELIDGAVVAIPRRPAATPTVDATTLDAPAQNPDGGTDAPSN